MPDTWNVVLTPYRLARPMKLRSPPFAIGLCVSALALAQEGRSPRVAIVPFAALSGDVPQRAGPRAAALLSTELRNVEGLTLVEAGRTATPDPHHETLQDARRLVADAGALRAARKFGAAEAALEKALAAYARGAPGLTEVAELQDAYVLLSAIRYGTGRDEEAARALETGLALAPARQPPLAATSALFDRVVKASRKALLEAPKGVLLIESNPPGATAFVDGVSLGHTPLKVSDVPPGVHTWSVHLPSGEVVGGLAQVLAQKEARVSGQAGGEDAASKVLDALSRNRIDATAVEAARAHARSIQADVLIFGALSRDGRGLALDSFALETATGKLKRLPRTTFDTELLSAGIELYHLAGRLAKEGVGAGSDTPLPGPVSPEWAARRVAIAEVRYGGGAGGDAQAPSSPERKPLEPKRRAPLKPRAP